MAREFFELEKGISVTAENTDTAAFQILQGAAAPGGDAGEQDAAPLGSLYFRSGTSELYKKNANGGAPADWDQLTTSDLTALSWRSELVRAATEQALIAGNTDPTTWADNDSGIDNTDFAIGEYVLGDVDGTPALWEITGISAPNITLAAASDPLADNDSFMVRRYLPDAPAGQENQALVLYNGTSIIKIADVDWNFADGINIASPYTAGSGDITSADTVQGAIQKLDGNNDDQDTLLGTAQGDTDLGTFSGATIPDNSTVKGALQSIETAYEETDANVDDLITLSGVPENSTDLGTFTGTTISDSNTVKGALQEIETAHETLSTSVTEIDGNVDDLITLSGMPENSTDNGTFTGDLFADSLTTKQVMQRIEDLLEEIKVLEVTGITAATSVDEVPVATVSACKWLVEAFEEATPANKKASEVYGLNNGTLVDDTQYAKIKVGANFNLTLTVDISGGNMRLRATSSTAGVTVRARRIQVTNI